MPDQMSELDTESPRSPRKTHFWGNSTRRNGDVTRGKSVSLSRRLVAVFGMAYDREVEGKDLVTEAIIVAAIEVHRHLGPGLLESTYEQCLCWELRDAGLTFVRQTMIPINYKGNSAAGVYRPDLVVEDRVMIEIKAVDRLASVHQAQLLTYMRHTGIKTGLLLNFNCPRLRDGLKRLSL